jgi:hypothetical protein
MTEVELVESPQKQAANYAECIPEEGRSVASMVRVSATSAFGVRLF